MALKNLIQQIPRAPVLLSGVAARQFNGVDQTIIAPVDLSGFSIITICFWMWWDAYATDDDMCFEYSDGSNYTGAFYLDPNSSGGNFDINDLHDSGGGHYWRDSLSRPSAAAWHHYGIILDRSGPSNAAWVDGSSVTVTANNHFAGSYSNFGNFNLYMMSRANSILFGAGRLADVALYAGAGVSGTDIATMAGGRRAKNVRRANLLRYYPLGLGTPEPDKSGNNVSATVIGATYVAGPPTLEEYVDDLTTITKFSGVESRIVTDSGTIGSVSSFSGAEVYTPSNLDATTFNPKTTFSGVDVKGHDYLDSATATEKTTFSGADSFSHTDAATFNPKASFSGIDHYCIYVPEFTVVAQNNYQVTGLNNYQLDVIKRFIVVAELNPGSNPC